MAAAAGITAAGSLLGGITAGKGAKSAARIQAQAADRATQEQARQYNVTREDYSPYRDAGTGALGPLMALLGLSGSDAQASALSGLRSSPLFTGAYGSGVDTILANASATGGLRGGNVNDSLAQFGSGLLSAVLGNQLDRLGGLVSTGAGAVNGTATAGINSANNISNLALQSGNASATGVLGQSAAFGRTVTDLSRILASQVGGGFKGNSYVAAPGFFGADDPRTGGW